MRMRDPGIISESGAKRSRRLIARQQAGIELYHWYSFALIEEG